MNTTNNRLTFWQKAAFGFGAFGKDIAYMLVATYLLNYYNVVLGMNSAFVGVVMMVARVLDAIDDPLMGIIVAKTKTRWGRFRPWILSGTVLNAFVLFALFATPDGVDPNGQLMHTWLIVAYFLWSLTYSMMDIPFWSMIPAITDAGKEREEVSALARAGAGIGDAVPAILTMTVVPLLGAGAAAANLKTGYTIWALIIAVVFVISEIICVVAVKERKTTCQEKPVTVKQMFVSLLRNDQALTVVASMLLVYASLGICGNLLLYFFQFDVGNASAYSVFTAAAFAAQVLTMMLIPFMRRFFSRHVLYIAGFIIQVAGYGVFLLLIYSGIYTAENWQLLILPGAVIYIGYGMLNVIMTVMLSDSVDYGEYKNKSREESVIFSLQTFTVKFASGIAVMLDGFVIQWIGLDVAEAASNTLATLQGLRLWMTIPPILLLTAGLLIYLKFYKLDEKRMAEIRDSIRPDAGEEER